MKELREIQIMFSANSQKVSAKEYGYLKWKTAWLERLALQTWRIFCSLKTALILISRIFFFFLMTYIIKDWITSQKYMQAIHSFIRSAMNCFITIPEWLFHSFGAAVCV